MKINCVQIVTSVHLRFFEPLNLVACGLLTWISMETEGSITLLCLSSAGAEGGMTLVLCTANHLGAFKEAAHIFTSLVEYSCTAYTILNTHPSICACFLVACIATRGTRLRNSVSFAGRYAFNSLFLSRARDFMTFTLHDLTDFYIERATAPHYNK